jgi:hypothetical protein
MSEVSTFRLYLLRAMYLLIVVGLGIEIWPGLLHPPSDLPHMNGVVRSVLGAVSLLAVLGIRYPLKMIPLLFFELVWKTLWVVIFGLPLWSAHRLTPATAETLKACLMGVVLVPLVMPWGYVFANYARIPGDRWGKRPAPVRSDSLAAGR